MAPTAAPTNGPFTSSAVIRIRSGVRRIASTSLPVRAIGTPWASTDAPSVSNFRAPSYCGRQRPGSACVRCQPLASVLVNTIGPLSLATQNDRSVSDCQATGDDSVPCG